MLLDRLFDALLNALGKKVITILILLSFLDGIAWALRNAIKLITKYLM